MLPLDDFDLRILHALQRDGRRSNVALAERVNLSASQCARRVARLERAGAIAGYRALIAPEAVGLGVTALVSVTLEKHGESRAEAFHEAVRSRPEITECAQITGDADYHLRVVVPTLKHLSAFVNDQLMRLPEVAQIRSSIVLDEVKGPTGLPLPDAAG